jgi:hypothetical protein
MLRITQNKAACTSLARASMSATAVCRALVSALQEEISVGKGDEVLGSDGQTRAQLVSRVAIAAAFTINNLSAAAQEISVADAALAAQQAAAANASPSRKKAPTSASTAAPTSASSSDGSGAAEGDQSGSAGGAGSTGAPSSPSLGKYGLLGVAVTLVSLVVKGVSSSSAGAGGAGTGASPVHRTASPSSTSGGSSPTLPRTLSGAALQAAPQSKMWVPVTVPEAAAAAAGATADAGAESFTKLEPSSVVLHSTVNALFNLSNTGVAGGLDKCVEEVAADFASIRTMAKTLMRPNVDPQQLMLVQTFLAALTRLTEQKTCINMSLIRPSFILVRYHPVAT